MLSKNIKTLDMSDKDAFYKKLKGQLDDTTNFPSNYLYKFIVPSSGDQLETVEGMFNNKGAVITTKKSKTGKYVSISITVNLESSDEVILYYRKVEEIEGIISL